MRRIGLSCPGWDLAPVAVPETFRERRRGMKGRPAPAMLFRTVSVHGMGMRTELTLAVLDRDGVVVDIAALRPGGVCVRWDARWILELAPGMVPPPLGSTVGSYPLADDGTAGGVRHTDREPGGRLRAARLHPRRR